MTNIKKTPLSQKIFYAFMTIAIILIVGLYMNAHSQEYRLASLPQHGEAEFYGKPWKSLRNPLRFMGSQNGILEYYDTANIEVPNHYGTPGMKEFDKGLYSFSYWSSYGMSWTLPLDSGYHKAQFHFLQEAFNDTTTRREIVIRVIKNGLALETHRINTHDYGYNRPFTFDIDFFYLSNNSFVRFEIVNDFSKSVKDNYVSVAAFELVNRDSLFSTQERINPVFEQLTYPAVQVDAILLKMDSMQNILDRVRDYTEVLQADTLK